MSDIGCLACQPHGSILQIINIIGSSVTLPFQGIPCWQKSSAHICIYDSSYYKDSTLLILEDEP